MTSFFMPQVKSKTGAEDIYAGIRKLTADEAGCEVQSRRIFSLWARRGAADCVTEVGKPDPVNGELVLAILDLGEHQPYVIHCGQPGCEDTATRETVGSHVYSVTEFAR